MRIPQCFPSVIVMATVAGFGLLAAIPSRSQVLPPGLTRETLLQFQPRSSEDALHQLRRLNQADGPGSGSGHVPALEGAGPSAREGLPGFARWSEFGPPSREDHSLVYDSRRDRYLVTGGNAWHPAQNVWAFTPDAPSAWSAVFTGDTTEAWFEAWAAVYDSLHDRLVAVELANGAPARVWELSLAHPFGWTPLAIGGAAPMLVQTPTLAWDEAGQRLFVLGQDTSPWSLALFEVDLDGDGWAPLHPSGVSPDLGAARHAMVFDDRRGTLVVGDRRLAFDSGAHWAPLGPGMTFAPELMGLVYDRAGDQLVGAAAPGDFVFTWREGETEWSWLGPFPEYFHSRRYAPIAWDPARRRLITSGGFSPASFRTSSELAALALDTPTGWQDLGVYSGESRMWHTAVVDEVHDRMLVHGGWLTVNPQATTMVRPLDGSPPVPLAPAPGPHPRERFGHMLVYDSIRNRLLVQGGQATDGTGDYLSDLWSLDLASDPPQWTQLPELPGNPGIRYFGCAFFDAAHDRLVTFGGANLSGYPAGVWALEFAPTPHWRMLGTSGDQDGSGPHTCFFDASRSRAWLDPSPTGVVRMDVEADSVHFVSLPVWGPSDARIAFTAFDPRTERCIGFGKPEGESAHAPSSLWLLQLGSSPALSTEPCGGAFPMAYRYLEATVFDARRSRLVMYGGYDDRHHYFDDWFALAFDQPVPVLADLVSAELAADGIHLSWSVIGASTRATVERAEHEAAWAPVAALFPDGEGRVRWIDGDTRAGTTYRYRLRLANGYTTSEATVVVPAAVQPLRLAAERNPTPGPLSFLAQWPGPGPAELELFDLGGRRVRSATLRRTSAEPQRATLDGGDAPAPGLYWARLRAGGESVTTRVIVSR